MQPVKKGDIMKESGEMYLETIHYLTKQGKDVRAIDIGEHMGFSKPSVSRAMKILKQNEYITIDKDGFILLTETGLQVAEKIYERHTTLTAVLSALGVDDETAEEDACRIEHYISDTTFKAVKNYYEKNL